MKFIMCTLFKDALLSASLLILSPFSIYGLILIN